MYPPPRTVGGRACIRRACRMHGSIDGSMPHTAWHGFYFLRTNLILDSRLVRWRLDFLFHLISRRFSGHKRNHDDTLCSTIQLISTRLTRSALCSDSQTKVGTLHRRAGFWCHDVVHTSRLCICDDHVVCLFGVLSNTGRDTIWSWWPRIFVGPTGKQMTAGDSEVNGKFESVER